MQRGAPPRCCAPPPSAPRHVQGPEYAPAPPSNGPAVKGLRAPQGVPPPVAPRRLGNCTKLDQRLEGVANPWDESPAYDPWLQRHDGKVESGTVRAAPAEHTVVHTVESGDTLGALVCQHVGPYTERSLDRVKALNAGMDSDALQVGQTVTLPTCPEWSKTQEVGGRGSWWWGKLPAGMFVWVC